MRLTSMKLASAPHGIFARVRSAFDPGMVDGRAVCGHHKIAAGTAAVGSVWDSLIEAFCATIEPVVSRLSRDLRLVAAVTISGDVELHGIVNGVSTPIGALAAIDAAKKQAIAKTKWTAVELRLPPALLLERSFSWPAASRDFLAPIIEHRLERLTPWHPDRVLYGYRTVGDADPAGGIDVALTATCKDLVAGPLKALAEAGLVATAIGSQSEPYEAPLRVNLIRGQTKTSRVGTRRLVSRVMSTSLGILAIGYLASSFWVRAAVDAQHEASARFIKARHLIKAASMTAVGDREKALLEAKRPDRAMVVLVDQLAKSIPDNTFLKELAVTPEHVRLVGISEDAPALVAQLEAAGLLNVHFTSAVTRETDQKDSFEITGDRAGAIIEDEP